MRRGLVVGLTTAAAMFLALLLVGVWLLSGVLSQTGSGGGEGVRGPDTSVYGRADGAPETPAAPVSGDTSADGSDSDSTEAGAAEPAAGEAPPAEGSPAQQFAVDREWAQEMSGRSGIAARALAAYASAAQWATAEYPECRVGWNTIAGIGWVESHHGTIGEAEVDADGVVRPHVIGIQLNGEGATAEIRDTDGGELDGDTEYDRAVGPMQFIPQTWRRHQVDARGTGAPDPHSIDDAAFTTVRYLCSGGRDLTSDTDWVDAVLAYNASRDYVDSVFAAAQFYAEV